jgi:hypothetical protein
VNALALLSGLAALLVLAECEVLTPRLAPVQSARIVQAEAFRQTFMVAGAS